MQNPDILLAKQSRSLTGSRASAEEYGDFPICQDPTPMGFVKFQIRHLTPDIQHPASKPFQLSDFILLAFIPTSLFRLLSFQLSYFFKFVILNLSNQVASFLDIEIIGI